MKVMLKLDENIEFVELTEEQLKVIDWLVDKNFLSDYFEIIEIEEDFKKI